MRLFLAVIILSTFYHRGICQNFEKIDEISEQICDFVIANSDLEDSELLNVAYEKNMYPYLYTINKEKHNNIIYGTIMRLYRICPEYVTTVDRTIPEGGHGKLLKTKLSSRLSQEESEKFFQIKDYYYLESNGDTTDLTLTENLWIDKFPDQTYSKLSVEKITNSLFKVKFIESNNSFKSAINRPDDSLLYDVIEKKDNYYFLVLTIPETQQQFSFKLFIK